jgi:hypothetical protein
MQMSFILISVGNFVLATLPQYRDENMNGLPIPSPDSKQFPFFVVEIFCILYFVLEVSPFQRGKQWIASKLQSGGTCSRWWLG